MANTSATGALLPYAHKRARGAGFESFFHYACWGAATTLLCAMAGICVLLAVGGWPAISTFGLSFFTSTVWNPVTDVYGGAGPILGTLITSVIALLVALPLAFLTAVFLTEFCPHRLRRPIGIAVELLAGIPSIVYGMWGLFVFAPLFAIYIEAPVMAWAAPGTIWERLFSGIPNGSGVLTASIILAIMILPFIAATLRELFLTIPPRVREAAYGVGCTPLETVWSVTLPYVRRSAIGAVMLGLGRALGETMAVTFVIGNSHHLPRGLFDSGATISSTIANEFAEATSAMHISALLALGFVLFLITFVVLALARALLGHGHTA
ncbi:MAG TPA: phosphate ABC transporter permease subunit PstC [Rhizomicrobium sp.]|jgi:phosphate transport system permease protein|nr:phosphate ABC transporter permease subunit PstC [Rhizomicrobium sp.]